jgi:hypothetical protein
MLSTELSDDARVLFNCFISGRFKFNVHGFLGKFAENILEERDLVVSRLHFFSSKSLNDTQVWWKVSIIGVLD